MAIIALDVGGSSIKSALVEHGQIIGERRKTTLNSQADRETLLTIFQNTIETHLHDHTPKPIQGIGVGFPAPFDYAVGTCYIPPQQHKYQAFYQLNLPQNMPIQYQNHLLEWRFRNDAESAIAGEAMYGAGRPYGRFIGVTLGTGLGAAFWADGKAIRQGIGQPEGELYAVPVAGKMADDVFSIRGLLTQFETAQYRFENVQEASDQAENDTTIQAIFARFGQDLGDFLRPFVVQFQAEAVLVLGGISGAYRHFAPHARLEVPLVLSSLGMDAALLGAAALFE